MEAFAWLMIVSSVLLAAATVFFIYALGLAILRFDIKILIVAVILLALAMLMQLILSVIND
jgi:hypothetical protein